MARWGPRSLPTQGDRSRIQGDRSSKVAFTIFFSCGERSEPHRSRGVLCANAQGFSLHAGVRCDANDRQGIEQLCRYITRPAISNERLAINREGNVVLGGLLK